MDPWMRLEQLSPKIMIDSYKFGNMVINGQSYSKDLIILPGGKIISPWWRKKGHRLVMADIAMLVEAKPDIIIIGTGKFGLIKPAPQVSTDLRLLGIKTVVRPTKDAATQFNNCAKTGESTGACFHLTC